METRKLKNWETGIPGSQKAGKLTCWEIENWETGILKNREIKKLGRRETRKLINRVT